METYGNRTWREGALIQQCRLVHKRTCRMSWLLAYPEPGMLCMLRAGIG